MKVTKATVVKKELSGDGKVKSFTTLLKGRVARLTSVGAFVYDPRDEGSRAAPEWFSTNKDSLIYAVLN